MSWDVWHVPLNSAECRRVLFLLWDDMMRSCWGAPIKLGGCFTGQESHSGRVLMRSAWELINLYSRFDRSNTPPPAPASASHSTELLGVHLLALDKSQNCSPCTLTHELWASVYLPSQRHSDKEYHEVFTDLATTRNANVFPKDILWTSQFTLLSGTQWKPT